MNVDTQKDQACRLPFVAAEVSQAVTLRHVWVSNKESVFIGATPFDYKLAVAY